ncbi:MAG: C_GCAxxG_C_C family protein [Candidatus Lokiarchaeota archaeon]|nr:C_GCAxxG_C_C family protein [Candidatus Lokiarchaeota archaeon]
MENEKYNEIVTKAYSRMHKYTCAEATLQACLELWQMDKKRPSWATAGYMGAILSGDTTCGLLIGTSVAIGLKRGNGLDGLPEDLEKERDKAIREVNKLYKTFKREMGSTRCKDVCGFDFSDADQGYRFIQTKAWKTTCDKGLRLVLDFIKERTDGGNL